MSKKILFCFNTSRYALHHRLGLMLACQREGLEVHAAIPSGPEVEDLQKHGIGIHVIEMSRQGANPLAELFTLFRLYRLIAGLRPDYYHGFTIKPVIYGALACRFVAVKKCFFTISGMGSAFLQKSVKARVIRGVLTRLYRLAFRRENSHVVFQNPQDREFFLSQRWVREDKCSLIPGTGVNCDKFQPSPAKQSEKQFEKHAKKYDEFTMVFAGRLIADKGLRELTSACTELHQEGRAFKLVIFGQLDPGNPSGFSQEEWQELSARPFVDWRGFQADISAVLPHCHVACLPSYREGFPLFLLEAGACGLPSVATDVPGCNDLIRDRLNGLLVPAKDSSSLKQALAELLLSPELCQTLGRQARQHVLQNYSEDQVLAEYTDLYRPAGQKSVAA